MSQPQTATLSPDLHKPNVKPARPEFSSGPCAKRPGWTVAALENALVGRSHRSKVGKARIYHIFEGSQSAIIGKAMRMIRRTHTGPGRASSAQSALTGRRAFMSMSW